MEIPSSILTFGVVIDFWTLPHVFFTQLAMHRIMNLIPGRMEWGGRLEAAADSAFCNSHSSANVINSWRETTSPSLTPVWKRVESARLNVRDGARRELFCENWGLKLLTWAASTGKRLFFGAVLQHGDLLGEIVHGCAWEWSPHVHVVSIIRQQWWHDIWRWARRFLFLHNVKMGRLDPTGRSSQPWDDGFWVHVSTYAVVVLHRQVFLSFSFFALSFFIFIIRTFISHFHFFPVSLTRNLTSHDEAFFLGHSLSQDQNTNFGPMAKRLWSFCSIPGRHQSSWRKFCRNDAFSFRDFFACAIFVVVILCQRCQQMQIKNQQENSSCDSYNLDQEITKRTVHLLIVELKFCHLTKTQYSLDQTEMKASLLHSLQHSLYPLYHIF